MTTENLSHKKSILWLFVFPDPSHSDFSVFLLKWVHLPKNEFMYAHAVTEEENKKPWFILSSSALSQ